MVIPYREEFSQFKNRSCQAKQKVLEASRWLQQIFVWNAKVKENYYLHPAFLFLEDSEEAMEISCLPTKHPLSWENKDNVQYELLPLLLLVYWCSFCSYSLRGYLEDRYPYKCNLLPMSKQVFFFFLNSFSRALKHSSPSLRLLAASCLWQGRKGSIPKVTRLCEKWE